MIININQLFQYQYKLFNFQMNKQREEYQEVQKTIADDEINADTNQILQNNLDHAQFEPKPKYTSKIIRPILVLISIFFILFAFFYVLDQSLPDSFDQRLFNQLKTLYEKKNPENILELGPCIYTQKLKKLNYEVQCYYQMGNSTQNVSLGLSIPQNLSRYDWVQSLGALQFSYEKDYANYIDTLTKSAKTGIIFCPTKLNGKKFNRNEIDYLKRMFRKREFLVNTKLTSEYRANFSNSYKTNFFIFEKVTADENGAFNGKGDIIQTKHRFLPELLEGISELYKSVGAKTIADFGGGLCTYAEQLDQLGYDVECYDGNQYVQENTKFGKNLDLSAPQNLGKQFDWVQSFEVGEHIPPKSTEIYIDNLVRHARNGLVLSWAIVGQGGFHHINQRPVDQIVGYLQKRGFTPNWEWSNRIRNRFSKYHYFHNDLVVYQRQTQKIHSP